MNSRPGRLGSLAFGAVFAFVAATVLLPSEFTHYKRWLDLGAQDTGLRIAVLSALLAKSLAALAAGLTVAAIAGRWVSPGALRIGSVLITLLALGILSVDLELQANTGNNLRHYLPFLFDANTFVWAGEGFDAGPGLLRVTRRLLLTLCLAGLVAWIVERWAQRGRPSRDRLVLGLAGAVCVAVLVAAPVTQRRLGNAAYLYHLYERLPWAWMPELSMAGGEISQLQDRAESAYLQSLPYPAHPPATISAHPTRRPDIFMIVVESLRHDALDRETMPRLWEWSQRGLRSTRHYATSNASHFGLFALLYGRSPLLYFETLDAGIAPTLPAQLRQWGYTTHYVACTDLSWRGMDQFLGPAHFAVERPSDERLEVCDQKVTTRASELLAERDRPPRFVLAFLMSTHFGYHHPESHQPFQPAAPPPNAIELRPEVDREAVVNRYRNSAHYLDALVGQVLDALAQPEEVLIVFTGDHGESLFDDGTIAHSSLLSEIQTRVPLIVTGPGIPAGTHREDPTDHTSLLPTLFARLGIAPPTLAAFPGSDMLRGEGPGYAPLVHAKSRPGGPDRLALVSSEHRFSFRLDPGRGSLRFLGPLGANGRPARTSLKNEGAATAMRWWSHFLEANGRAAQDEARPRDES